MLRLVVIAAQILIVNGQIYSLYAYEYYNSTYQPDDTAYIQGYYGAAYGDVESIGDNKEIHCSGAYSCYKTRTLQADDDLRCRGMLSCAFSRLIYSTSGGIRCEGELACYGANINISTTSSDMFITGAAAAMNAYLYPANSVNHWIYGYMGIANAIAESTSGTTKFFLVCQYMTENFVVCVCIVF